MLKFLLIFITILSIANYLVGYFLVKYPPKDINGIIGYRTSKSSKNQRTWDFAQKYSGKIFKNVAGGGFIISITVTLIFATIGYTEEIFNIIIFGQVFEVFIPIIFTEKRLAKYINDKEYLLDK